MSSRHMVIFSRDACLKRKDRNDEARHELMFPSPRETTLLSYITTLQPQQTNRTAITGCVSTAVNCSALFSFHIPNSDVTLISSYHLIYPLTARVVGAPQMISQPVSSISPCSPLHSTGELQACPFPGVVFPPLPLPCLLPPFTVPCKMVLARPDERETSPYHCSLRLFTMVRRSSCGPIACWILARTSSSVTWSLYKMRSILR